MIRSTLEGNGPEFVAVADEIGSPLSEPRPLTSSQEARGKMAMAKASTENCATSSERRDLLHIDGGLAAALQQGACTFVAGIPTAGTRGTRLARKASGANAGSKLSVPNGPLPWQEHLCHFDCDDPP